MKTVVFLVFELCAHNQFTQWADNSKTNRAIVFILAHDTRFDRLSSPVKLSYMVQTLLHFSITDSQVGDMRQ